MAGTAPQKSESSEVGINSVNSAALCLDVGFALVDLPHAVVARAEGRFDEACRQFCRRGLRPGRRNRRAKRVLAQPVSHRHGAAVISRGRQIEADGAFVGVMDGGEHNPVGAVNLPVVRDFGINRPPPAVAERGAQGAEMICEAERGFVGQFRLL
ncbi:hypothetical protein [Pannonibacter sp. SL95]|uniref:hypothetical protein n=1 Tax=Pannonibacter sp. SL95 TaxID=2995153 RepID=UPI002273EF65|nr:hypothetical protein [Pannonibacter sp. SL95]MCY1704469.1 hypothetical protein [Pannonibacter sp. SL95]